jgi:hypothetical protein
MASGVSIVGADGFAVSSVPAVVGVKPCGTQVLVEILTAQEALGTKLVVSETTSASGAPQGYILAVGPKVSSDLGFQIGDRVTLHGNFTPLPEGQKVEKKNPDRPWILVEPHQIKAVFVEDR